MLEKIKISIRRKVIISRNIPTFFLLILCCFGFVIINNISSNIIGRKFALLLSVLSKLIKISQRKISYEVKDRGKR